MFASSHFYIILKLIATVYERLVKAQQLIAAQAKVDFGEASQHGEERFDMFIGVLLLSMNQQPNDRKLDQSSYEDYVRIMLGHESYLLSGTDRLITTVSCNIKLKSVGVDPQEHSELVRCRGEPDSSEPVQASGRAR